MNKLQLAFIRIRDFFIELLCKYRTGHSATPFTAYYVDEDGCNCGERFFVCTKCGKII